MRKTFKKLLAMAVVAVMLVSTLVSGLVVSAATPGSLNFEATTTVVEGKDAAVAFKLTFTDPMSALHMLTTITSDLKIADVTLGDVTYVTAPVDPEDPELESPALRIDTKNLDAGKILFESGIAGAVEVTEVNFTVTFDTDALAVGEKTFAIAVESTNYDEANFDAIEMTGKVVVEAAAPECDHANAVLEYAVVDGNCVTTKVCDCGYEEVIASTANIKFGHAPVYESALTLIFRMPATHVSFFANYTDVKAIVTKDMYDGTTKIAPVVTELEGELQANTNRTQFVYNGVRAMDMTANLNCQVFGTDANGNVVLLAEEDYTFAKYLETAFNAYKNAAAGTKNAAECKLVADVAYYGAAAQIHFGFNTDNLASANIPESYTTGTFALEDFNFDGTLDQSGVSFGRSPNYRDKILLNIRFVKSAVADGAYVTVDYKTTSGSDEQIRVDFAAFEQDPSNANRYQVVFDKLTAACIPTEFTIKLCDATGAVLGHSVYGMEIYAYQATKSSSISSTEKALVNELVAYGRSANAYFNFGK